MSLPLYPWQAESVTRLVEVIRARGAAVDASDTGTGKTLVAVETVRALGDPPTLVVCPKAVIPTWRQTAAEQGVELDVINYEKLISGRTPFGRWEEWRGHRVWRWVPEVRFVIFDEVHRCKGLRTLSSKILRACRPQQKWVLGLSATLADSPLDLYALGYVLRLHDGTERPSLRNPNPMPFTRWAGRFGARPGIWSWLEWDPPPQRRAELLGLLHRELFPACGVRVRYADLPEAVVKRAVVSPELVELDPANVRKIQKAYEAMREIYRLRELAGSKLTELLRLRQEAELAKIPAFVEYAEDALAGASVVIFVNFSASLNILADHFQTRNVIDGSQTGDAGARERQEIVARFQAGEINLLICNLHAGGVGLSLHDVHGDCPRVTLISPTWSAKLMRQVLGRVDRVGSRSAAVQRILCAAGTVEEKVYANLRRRLQNLDRLQDGELTLEDDP